jgi:hypothetical protein
MIPIGSRCRFLVSVAPRVTNRQGRWKVGLAERGFAAFLGPTAGNPFAEGKHSHTISDLPYSGWPIKFNYLERRLNTLVRP